MKSILLDSHLVVELICDAKMRHLERENASAKDYLYPGYTVPVSRYGCWLIYMSTFS